MEQVVELLKTISSQLAEVIEHQKRLPLVYSVNMGNIMELAHAPAQVFQQDFLDRLAVELPQMVKATPKTQKLDPSKSNEYKKTRAEA